jgi:tol-pal system protein YbgF
MSIVMTHNVFRTLIALALIISAAGPVSAANREHQQLAADLRMLQEQAQQLQNLIGSLTDALKAVNARLDEQAAASRKSFADEKLLIDNLTNDLRVVREKVDDNNVRVGSLAQEVDSLRQLVQQALSRPQPTTSDADLAGAAPGTPAAQANPPAPAAPSAVGASPTKAWEQAYGDYAAGLWDLAVDGFEAYIRDFPKSDTADDAQLLIGRSYVNAAKYDKAVEAFDKLIRAYPSSNSVPDAYYLKGLALRTLKQTERACEAFDYVVKTYPDSNAGGLARQARCSAKP